MLHCETLPVLFISHFVLIGSHTWLKRETSGIPPKAQSLSAVVYGGKIFTFGGVLNGEAQNSVHILDTGRTLKTFRPGLGKAMSYKYCMDGSKYQIRSTSRGQTCNQEAVDLLP